MAEVPALLVFAGGIVLVVAGAELFFDGVLSLAGRLGISAFVLTAVVSGFELENLAAGIAANARGLSGAAAGTFLGGTTFLALAVAGLAAVVAPIQARLPLAALAWTVVSPLPLVAFAADGRISRLEGAALIGWFLVAIFGLARPRRRGTRQRARHDRALRRPQRRHHRAGQAAPARPRHAPPPSARGGRLAGCGLRAHRGSSRPRPVRRRFPARAVCRLRGGR